MTYYPARGWDAPARPAAAQARRDTLIDYVTGGLAIFMLLIFSQGWIRPLMGESVDPANSGLIRNLYFPAYFAGIALLVLNAGDAFRVLIRQPFLILIMGLVVASMTWSIDPGETMRRAVAQDFTVLAAVSLAARFSWPRLIELMAITFGILCVLSLVMGVAVHSIGRMPPGSQFPGAWRGLWGEKNAMGGYMAVFMPAFTAAAILHPKRRWLWIGMGLLCLALVLLSTSKTSLVAIALGVAATMFVALVRRGPASAVAFSYLAVLAALAGVATYMLAAGAIFDALGKDATLTGRTQIWAAVMTQVKHHPWLGHGYGTIWSDKLPWTPLAWIIHDAGFRPYHSHSSWYEQLLWLGIVGLIAWSLFFAQTMISGIVAAFRDAGAYMALPFLLIYAMISLTESVSVTYNDLNWVLFVAIACKLAYRDPPPEGARA